MGGLGEHVEGVQALQAIAGLCQVFQVARQCAGVAGDVDNLAGSEVGQRVAGFGVQASAGWVEHCQVDRLDLIDDSWQNFFHCAFIEADIVKIVQVAHKIETGRAGALDSGQPAGMGGEKTGEESDADVELESLQVFLPFKKEHA